MSAVAEFRTPPGTPVLLGQEVLEVIDYVDLEHLVLRNAQGDFVTKHLNEVRPVRHVGRERKIDLAKIDPSKWMRAEEICRNIKYLLELPEAERTLKEVQKIATVVGRHHSTIYRWVEKYKKSQRLSCLLRPEREDAGKSRLKAEVLEVMDECIDKHFLTQNRKSMATVSREVKMVCQARGLHVPHISSLRTRIGQLDPEVVEARRYGKKRAEEKFLPLIGSFPNADYPLAVVQMDHTPMDAILVDDEERKPIGRAYLTIAIDVCTKMIVGFAISLDHPGSHATGQCLLLSILPKEDWLKEKNIPEEFTWPCRGFMRKIHTDNAAEFRGQMLRYACGEHNIVPELRPKGKARYGGTVERAFRTFMKKIHEEVPGTTFSSVHDKVNYDSEGHAVMTLGELERWFTLYVLGIYHQHEHRGNENKMSPHYKWEKFHLEGMNGLPPLGLPPAIENVERLRLDLLPFFEATVQRYGIRNWSIDWFSPRIRALIGTKGDHGNARKFICRFNPRDLSKIWLYDDRHKVYIEVPYRDITRPPVTLWQVKAAKRRLRDEGKPTTNEPLIFKAVEYMRKIVLEAQKSRTATRRAAQRIRNAEAERKRDTAKASAPASDRPRTEVTEPPVSAVPEYVPEIDILEELGGAYD